MEDILNASLAGGVMIGSSSDLVVHGVVSMAIGLAAGIFSTFGYAKITPWLNDKLGIHDTCGVINLHGLPGFFGGIIGGITASFSPDTVYGDDISHIFAARGGTDPRTAAEQGGAQFAVLGITVGIAIVSGIITGWIINREWFDKPTNLFEDSEFWHGIDEHEEDDKKPSAHGPPGIETKSQLIPDGMQYSQKQVVGDEHEGSAGHEIPASRHNQLPPINK